jgi:predicted LPLAT superfamily acyltransferase
MDHSPMSQTEGQAGGQGAWLRQRERGTALGIRLLLATHRVGGRGLVRLILRVVAFYYALFAGSARRASKSYLRRVQGHASFADVVRHIGTFAQCAFDRVLLASGRLEGFTFTRDGYQHLEALAQARRGAILLGAHLGSFEALRAMGEREQLTINVVAHFENARRITAMLRSVAPDFEARIIAIDPAAPHWVLRVQECIEAGELVAVLGDRTGLGEASVEVELLGGKVRLPTGPYALAAVLRCPIYLTFGLFHAPSTYALSCEPFVERVELPRARREQELAALAQRFADRLADHVRRAPLNWFNFFELWQ